MKKLVIWATVIGLAACAVVILGQAVRERISQRALRGEKHGDLSRSIKVADLTRTYLIHVPPNISSRSIPLVLVFHGGGSTPEGMSRYTRFDDLADKNGFIVVYPEGTKRQWNDGRLAAPKVDDVAFVRAILDEIEKNYTVDTHRIYATGISNGAIFSQRLACEMSGTLAAIAPVAGTMPTVYSPSCKPAAPISVLMVHGTDDPLVPYNGGMIRVGSLGIGGNVWSAADTINYWKEHDHCSSQPKRNSAPDADPTDGTTISEDEYAGCRDGTSVLLYTVNGGGHTWPGGFQYLPESFIGKTSKDMDATEVIWRFFASHPRH